MDPAFLTECFTKYGIVAIFMMVFLEYLNLPGFPAGIIMPLAGVMAAEGNITFGRVMVVTVAAGLAGSLVLYFLGRKGGQVFFRVWLKHFPGQKDALDRSVDWVRDHGCVGLFAAKLIPMLRTLISIPAGALKMPLGPYILSSTLGIMVWNLVFVGAGYVMRDTVYDVFVKLI
ncbi:MAG: DedA family protein [Clostridium sp.]|nr:DedA family protein [Acetatifactor muris]MCM1563403.1 DedA family protein [Clostridium sp.]